MSWVGGGGAGRELGAREVVGSQGVGRAQGSGDRRHGGRPAEGYVGTVAEHPDQADGRGVSGVRAVLRSQRRVVVPHLDLDEDLLERRAAACRGRCSTTCGVETRRDDRCSFCNGGGHIVLGIWEGAYLLFMKMMDIASERP